LNYYEHHLGDYLRDTAHLSMLEDGAYRRLIDAYYIRETPLPVELRDVFRLVRAQSKQDREAAQTVLQEFFHLTDAGWVHHRCDREIGRFREKSDKAKASIRARWDKARAASADEQQTNNDRNTDVSGSEIRTYNEGNTPRARPQTPDTRHQPSSRATSVVASKPRPTKKAPPDLSLTDDLKAWAAEHTPAVDADAELAKLKDHTFATARTDWPGTVRNWLRKAQEDANERAQRAPRPAATTNTEPEWRREQRERNEGYLGPAAARRRTTTIDAEARDAAPDLLG